MANLEDFDSVLKAIRKYDYDASKGISNLETLLCSNCEVKGADCFYLKHDLKILVERLAYETLLLFVRNEYHLNEEKAKKAFHKYKAIPKADKDAKAYAKEAWIDAEREVSNSRLKIEHIEYCIEAMKAA